MGKLTSTIGIPIKLLNEAQVRYLPPEPPSFIKAAQMIKHI
jgi:hypothetical protein